MKHLLGITVSLILLYSCSTHNTITQENAMDSTLPSWFSTRPYLSDSTNVHYFLNYQLEDSSASAKHGFEVAQIEFINKIDDTVEGIRTLQSDVEFWSSPAVIQSLRTNTYLLMDAMTASNEIVLRNQENNQYYYYIQISLSKDEIIEELKKSTDGELGARQEFWDELKESL